METTETVNATEKKPDRSVPLRVPAELDDRIEAARETTKLSKQDLMRLSMDRGLDLVVAALSLTPQQIADAQRAEASAA